MDARTLKAHKLAEKIMTELPAFKPVRRNMLPKPFDQLGRRSHAFAAGPVQVSQDHCLVFLYRAGEILTDSSFYGYFAESFPDGSFGMLMEFHWHPSHKGLHCKTACRSQESYVGRLLGHAPELNLSMAHRLDPRDDNERLELIRLFCQACNVTMEFDEARQSSLLQ